MALCDQSSHRIAHGYEDLRLSILWSIVVVELDPLKVEAERIVAAGT